MPKKDHPTRTGLRVRCCRVNPTVSSFGGRLSAYHTRKPKRTKRSSSTKAMGRNDSGHSASLQPLRARLKRVGEKKVDTQTEVAGKRNGDGVWGAVSRSADDSAFAVRIMDLVNHPDKHLARKLQQGF